MLFTELIKLYFHKITYQLIWKLSLTPVSFIRLSSRRCHWDDVRDDGNEAPPLLGLSCLHPLLNDVVPYWRQVVPSTVSVEARIQGSDIDSFLHSSFKPSGFSCQDFSVLQFHRMLRMFNVNVFLKMVELGLRCSLNLDFKDLSVSPTYVTSHSSHLILYTCPTKTPDRPRTAGGGGGGGVSFSHHAHRPHDKGVTDEADRSQWKLSDKLICYLVRIKFNELCEYLILSYFAATVCNISISRDS